jgi:hypothetical protein
VGKATKTVQIKLSIKNCCNGNVLRYEQEKGKETLEFRTGLLTTSPYMMRALPLGVTLEIGTKKNLLEEKYQMKTAPLCHQCLCYLPTP